MSTKVLLIRTGDIFSHQFSPYAWKMLYSKLPIHKVGKQFINGLNSDDFLLVY